MLRKCFLCLVFLIGFVASQGQFIYLNNASFEGEPQDATVPVGWFPCEIGTTPDILPGPWGIHMESSDGDTFLGLITREDGSWESITQRFKTALNPADCYSFTIDLAHSPNYAGYNSPLKVRIWAGQSKCNKEQLLLETDFIKNVDWKTFEVKFKPKKWFNYIVIEAHYSDNPTSVKGNVILDNISPIKICPRA
ncbi:MAG: hypothetical protein DHS20C18_14490 [Saprospiraceae bacterium]|nr:MAG: hypothetical protein DHS20C18_14490 [Saprospiraceae bacterium]